LEDSDARGGNWFEHLRLSLFTVEFALALQQEVQVVATPFHAAMQHPDLLNRGSGMTKGDMQGVDPRVGI
jgi:hypothetical protein